MLSLSAQSEQWLQILLMAATVLLIPLVIAGSVVLFKIAFLLHSVQDLIRVLQYELIPTLQDIGRITSNIGTMTQTASNSVESVRDGVKRTGPLMRSGWEKLSVWGEALFSGLGRSFQKS